MIKKFLIGILILVSICIMAGCSKAESGEESMEKTYQNITAQQAKEYMDEHTDYYLLDVRTEAEFKAGHIKGAMLMPYDQVESRALKVIPDKSKPILVYCRSGNRSAKAAKTLAKLGYENVMDFGGIIKWPYDIVED